MCRLSSYVHVNYRVRKEFFKNKTGEKWKLGESEKQDDKLVQPNEQIGSKKQILSRPKLHFFC